MNPKAVGWESAYAQARDFVSQLTLLEKINLTTGVGWENGPCVGNTGSVPRLGFKGICNQDSPQGVRYADYVSAFTSGQLAAATWDRGLLYARGVAMAEEHKGKGATVQLGPVAGPLGRVPEGGRNWEGFAADPMLTGVAMAETIKGMQDTGIIASAKHFIGNEQERFRQVGEAAQYGYNISDTLSANINDRTLHEMYLWPFADAVRAGVGSILYSYTQINNSYGYQNSKTLNNILKGELGFQGFVVSDWGGHQSGVSSALAGMDMSMPGDTAFDTSYTFFGTNLTVAILNGTMPSWRLDDMAMRIMAAYFKIGNTIEDQPDVNFNSWTTQTNGFKYAFGKEDWEQVNWHVDVRSNHSELIRTVAAAGTVLLKNDGALPLEKPKFIAVFGKNAGPSPISPNGCPDRSCDKGTLAIGWGSGTSEFPYLITPDSVIQARVVANGGLYESIFNNSDLDSIHALASRPDATYIIFGNADSGEGYLNVDGNEGDRNNPTFWQNADGVIHNISATCNNTIVVIHSAGLPGEQSGNSLIDILYGNVNPSGRTPFTWAKRREDYRADVLYEPNNRGGAPQQEFVEGVFIDYRHFDQNNIEPAFEFGFGLSYTTFNYSDLKITRKNITAYQPTTGTTQAAPVLGANYSTNLEDYKFPDTWQWILAYCYPYVNDTSSLEAASMDPYYNSSLDFIPEHAQDGSPQALVGAGDEVESGGNKMLYDVFYEVQASITNTGPLAGYEVAQLYLSLGGDNPPKQLRGFDRLWVEPGETVIFNASLTRRDLSNWDTFTQNWVINDAPKTAFVGSSSRKLFLEAALE
ncbi:beta-glucosidase A [Pestalotiopsis fici W106-1]|uniref:beta-glucosidase n=2 Tax=Fungi TaxID=4751 RepID=W3WV37_PESFW|nr:beta-glucosidase A [Pestalotiopsis fici W106-1]ETS77700.1 beta-glucosidase A [Pestalotiopsis fici W106-1]